MPDPKPQAAVAAGRPARWPRIAVTTVFVVHGVGSRRIVQVALVGYLSDPLHATGVVPGLGYATFALAMVTVRLSGNQLLTRLRPDRLLPGLAVVATAGFAAALLIADPPVIGRLSEWASLPVALGLLPLLTAFVVAGTLTAPALRTGRQRRGRAQCATAG